MNIKKGLITLIFPLAMASGCARTPGVVKGGLTPFSVTRDIIDVPLASMATFWNYVGEEGKDRFGQTNLIGGGDYNRHYSGGGVGIEVDVTYPVGKFLGGIFGIIDYIACRSFYPNFPEGISPWKSSHDNWGDFLFPNTQALWKSDKKIEKD